ncbi:MAG: class I SAM-dependent methyltransferase [Candidatus Omnitrophota bacterium]|nr:class I SAM-dependent methyltransferase [Candidatus Omnitrophota bacterium]
MDIQRELCKKIESDTKKSWELNWSKVDLKSINEIFDYPRVKKIIDVYLNYLPKKGLVLEAGCGLGQWVGYLRSKGYNIIGIDYNEPTIRQAKSYNPDIRLATADVRTLPFQDESLDTYISFGVIEHFIEGPNAALREAYRVLKKGGTALVTVPHRNIFTIIKSPIVWLKRSPFLRSIFSKEKKVYYYQKYFAPKKLMAKFNEAGYRVVLHKPIDHTFSLVEFSSFFRDKNTYDGESKLAVKWGNILEKFFPYICAGSNLFILEK